MTSEGECGWESGPQWRRHDWRVTGRVGRVRFFRRLAAVGLTLLLLAVWGLASLVWLAANKIFGPSLRSPFWLPVLALLIVFLLAVALLRIFRHVGLPFREVMEAAERVADGDYGVRVEERGPPPVRGLARAFNTMTERLGEHDQLRRNLMADIAHELRTPLTIIQGKMEGLIDGVYPRDDAQLTEVLDELHLLSRLIEDLRTLALSESGALRLERELTDVGELARDVVRAFATEAAAKQIMLKVEASATLPPAIIDAVRIRQVLNNLLSNALSHTPPGGFIETNVKVSDPRGILVRVHDTGSGMTQEEAERAFERFQKGPGSRGSGLGLSIARNLVLAHGGAIRAISQPGGGTTITFTVPVDAPQ